MGLNCMGPLIDTFFFSIVNISLLQDLDLVEFTDDSDFYGKDVTPRVELVGDTILAKRQYLRMLCGQYNKEKLQAFQDLVESTEDRLIVFYNFTAELEAMKKIAENLKI